MCCWSQGWQQQAKLITRMLATRVLFVLHKATKMMVDCSKGTQDCATQQPTKLVCCIAGASNDCKTTTPLMPDDWFSMLYCKKQQQRQCFLLSYHREQQWWLNAMSARYCLSNNIPYDRCGSTTSTIAKAQSASNNIDCNVTTTMLMMQQSFLVILQGAMTIPNKCKWRTNKATSTQQSNFHVVVCRMWRRPYCTTRQPAVQVCWGRIWQVRQRQHVHRQEHVCHKRKVHWVRQRQCVPCQGQIWGIRLGGRIRQGGPQQASCQKRRWQTPCQEWWLGWVRQQAPRHKCNWPHTSCKTTMRLCHKPPRYVPYKCTYVPYKGTFGPSDQGQMLDMWQGEDSQIHHLIRQICRFTDIDMQQMSNTEVATIPDVTTSLQKDTFNNKTSL